MEESDIKSALLHQIDKIGQNTNTLSKVLEFIETLNTPKSNLPQIEDDKLATYFTGV